MAYSRNIPESHKETKFVDIHDRLRLKATWYIEEIVKICKIVGREKNE